MQRTCAILALLCCLAIPSCMTGCTAFGPPNPATTKTTFQRIVSGDVVEQTITEIPYVDPQKQAHAEATKALFAE